MLELNTKEIFLIRSFRMNHMKQFECELEVIKLPPLGIRYIVKPTNYNVVDDTEFKLGEKLIVWFNYEDIQIIEAKKSQSCVTMSWKSSRNFWVKGYSFPMDAFITLEDWRNKKLKELLNY